MHPGDPTAAPVATHQNLTWSELHRYSDRAARLNPDNYL
jgi:hypothetical protein